MTTTPRRPAPLLPARRRRHARLIAALTNLIGACAEAAGEAYGPIAAAPPDQEAVEVQMLSCMRVAMSGPLLFDLARSEETARARASRTPGSDSTAAMTSSASVKALARACRRTAPRTRCSAASWSPALITPRAG
ncbi:hypothetical protein [Streptomyces anulatus]|uniref:hypothetical protein n=1 Tax=Streptomyces anulatus TaxID=1892 RepID=UPI0036B5402D